MIAECAVVAVYAGLFNRAPDPGGFEFWTEQGDNVAQILDTPEPLSLDVADWYRRILWREPDAEGLAYWESRPAGEALAGIVYSAENGCDLTEVQLGVPVVVTLQDVAFDIATEYGVDPAKFVRMIGCESEFDPTAKNSRSSARGLAQFLTGTWEWTSTLTGAPHPYGDRFDPVQNMEMAAFLISVPHLGGGWKHWDASAHCHS